MSAAADALSQDALSTPAGHGVFWHEVERRVHESESARGATYALGMTAEPELRRTIVEELLGAMPEDRRQAIEDVAMEEALKRLAAAANIVLSGRELLGIAEAPDPGTVAMFAALDSAGESGAAGVKPR